MVSVTALLSPTRIIGLTTSVFALIACAIGWFIDGAALRRRQLAAVLTALEAAVLFDMVFNGRWLLHDLLAKLAMAGKLYGERSVPQHVALVVLGSVLAAGIGSALWLFRGRPGASLAACGGILSLCCWWVEVISLHAVDSLLYRRVDGVMWMRLAWASFSLMTGAGILWDTYGGPAGWTSEAPPASPTPTV